MDKSKNATTEKTKSTNLQKWINLKTELGERDLSCFVESTELYEPSNDTSSNKQIYH